VVCVLFCFLFFFFFFFVFFWGVWVWRFFFLFFFFRLQRGAAIRSHLVANVGGFLALEKVNIFFLVFFGWGLGFCCAFFFFVFFFFLLFFCFFFTSSSRAVDIDLLATSSEHMLKLVSGVLDFVKLDAKETLLQHLDICAVEMGALVRDFFCFFSCSRLFFVFCF